MQQKLKDFGRAFKREIAVYRGVAQDARVPRIAKFLLGAAIGYALLPFDLIPDFIPVFGQLDDVVIVPLLVWLARRFVPREVLEEHRRRVTNTAVTSENGV